MSQPILYTLETIAMTGTDLLTDRGADLVRILEEATTDRDIILRKLHRLFAWDYERGSHNREYVIKAWSGGSTDQDRYTILFAGNAKVTLYGELPT